jgi:hypothetical protein
VYGFEHPKDPAGETAHAARVFESLVRGDASLAEPRAKRKRPRHRKHPKPKFRPKKRLTSVDPEVQKLLDDVSNLGEEADLIKRQYGEMLDRFDVDNRDLEFVTTDDLGLEHVNQAAIDQRTEQINELVAKLEELRQKYVAKLLKLQKVLDTLEKAIARMEQIVRAESATRVVGQPADIADLPGQRQGRARQRAGAPPAQIAADRKRLAELRGEYREHRKEIRLVPYDIEDDVNLPEYRLAAERHDISPEVLAAKVAADNKRAESGASTGDTGGGGSADIGAGDTGSGGLDQSALIEALREEIGRLKLAIGVEAVQLPILGSFQRGALHVPAHGVYELHPGEQVVPRSRVSGTPAYQAPPQRIEIELVPVASPELGQFVDARVKTPANADYVSVSVGREASRRRRDGRT